MLNYCAGGGYLAGAQQLVPEEKWRYNWGRAHVGCNRLRCPQCQKMVENSINGRGRIYVCPCEKYQATELDCLGEERTEGPYDTPVYLPGWRCIGHPLRPLHAPPPEVADNFADLDRGFNEWAGTARAGELALAFSKRAKSKKALLKVCLQFYLNNPQAPGSEVLSGLKTPPELADLWCRALKNVGSPVCQRKLRRLALLPHFAASAVESMEHDRPWLTKNCMKILALDPDLARPLCDQLAHYGYGWAQEAVATLPLEILRARAATIGRNQLFPEPVRTYWERDFKWIVENYARLQHSQSDFTFYIHKFLEERGWSPDAATIEVWRVQAFRLNDSYSVLPYLARRDRAWVESNLAGILDSSGTRGVWLLDILKREGSDLTPLLGIVRKRDPKDLQSSLKFLVD